MEENLKARLVLQIRALRLSQSDMKQARFAAEVIPSHQGEIRRLLETALVVTYARPFTDGLASRSSADSVREIAIPCSESG